MVILVKMVSLDRFGFCGRQLHPDEKHVGRVYEVMAMSEGNSCGVSELYGSESEEGAREYAESRTRALKREDGYVYKVLSCLDRETGEVVDLMDHEIEIVDISNGGAR